MSNVPVTTQPSGEMYGLLTESGGTLRVILNPATGLLAFAIQDDGTPMPLEPALDVINGDLADNPGVATNLTLHYQFIQNGDGDFPQRRALHFGDQDFDENDDVFGDATRVVLHSPISPNVGLLPFKGQLFVTPGFVGTSTGSASNPYPTAATAFAAAIANGWNAATLFLPAGVTLTENIVFPDTGGLWEISCTQSFTLNQGSAVARIVGTITASTTSASAVTIFALSNLFVQGNISGNSSVSLAVLEMSNVRQTGTITTTTSGTGSWLSNFKGTSAVLPNKFGGSTTGLVSIAGLISAMNWVFEGGATEADALAGPTNPPFDSTWRSCQFGSTNGIAVPIGLNGTTLRADFYDCTFVGPTTITAANANYLIRMDAASLASAQTASVGLTLVGTGIQLKTLNSNSGAESTVTTNVGSTAFGARNIEGLYEIIFDATLLVAGTGTLQVNAIYTDMTGTLITEAVAIAGVAQTLNMAGAAGLKARASMPFRHNGAAAPIAWSITGITGAGSVAFVVAIRRVN